MKKRALRKKDLFLVMSAMVLLFGVIGVAMKNNNEKVSGNNNSGFQFSELQSMLGQTNSGDDETNGIWISYIELNSMLKGKSEEQFISNINTAFANCKSIGVNTVYVHVRPFGDAIYPSELFPWSFYASGEQGVSPEFDPLQVMIDRAKANGLKFHAWFNPYRIKLNSSPFELSDDNMAVKDPSMVINWSGGQFYDPSNEKSRKLIIDGIKEVVSKYDVDGVQFDDYFYATPDMSVDAASYQQYLTSGGKLAQDDWRRENVDVLVKDTYSAIKEIKPKVEFGISPQGNNQNNFSSQFADVEKWATTSGYVDYIAPQIYWGYEHKSAPFSEKLEEWSNIVTSDDVDLIIGLGAYRSGKADANAGDGANEWIDNTDVLLRQIKDIQNNSKSKGFILYGYSDLFDSQRPQIVKEVENLRSGLVK